MIDDRDEWPWLDFGLTFSPPGRRGGLVQVPYGVPLPHVGGGYVGTVLAFTVSFGLFGTGMLFWFQSVVFDSEPWGWWWVALIVPAGLAMLVWGAGTYADGIERTMSSSAIWRIIGAAAAGAGLITSVAGLLGEERAGELFTGLEETSTAERFVLFAAVSLVAGVVLLAMGIRTAARARAEVQRVHRLRAAGRRVPGMILDVPDPRLWPSYSDVPIRIDDPRDERVIQMRVNTESTRIPVRGTRVIVFIGGRDDYHVELDPEHPPVFLKDTKPYWRDSADGGGM